MKTFRKFMLEATADIFGDEAEQARVRERDAAQARRRAARTGMSPEVEEAENKRKAFEKSGLSPEEARRRAYRNVKVSSQDAGFGPNKQTSSSTQKTSKQPTGTTQTPPQQPKATQTPPRQQPPKQPSGSAQTPPRSTQAPPKQPKASTPPPPKPPTSNVPAPTSKPPAAPPKGPGLRSRLGSIAGPAVAAAGAGLDYQARREAGQSRARAAGGAASQLAGYTAAAKFGAMVPGPPIVKGAAAIGAGLVGAETAGKAFDFAADKTRPARQAISRATGFDKFQQKNELIKKSSPGSSPAPLSSIARAQQTVDTRSARTASSAYGTKKGSALTGIGGKTVVSKDKKGAAFMSTGAGSQRKTVELAKTQLVRDPKTGKQVVGDLAFKGGKATYLARPSVSSRDTSLSARLGRALNIGKYSKAAEQQAAKQEYRTALKNTQTYQKKLGITPKAAAAQKLPGTGVGPKKVGPKKVGPKLVGPKIVGPKKVGPAKPQSTPGSSVRPA